MADKLIGLCGLIGSGKGTVGDILVKDYGFKQVSFGGPLKDAVSVMFNWPRHLLEGDTEQSRVWRELKDEWWSKRLSMHITPRIVLQQFGTEVMRKNFHDDIWVASVESKIESYKDFGVDVVVTDARFPNEIEMIKKSGGVVIEVERGERPNWYDSAKRYNSLPKNTFKDGVFELKMDLFDQSYWNDQIKKWPHPSEWSWIGLKCGSIDNNGTLDDLKNKVEDLILVLDFMKEKE